MVSSQIPQNSLFKSYKELKRHWKNSYGYRLPESDEGIIYLSVSFGRWFTESLTYPIMCVRAQRPVFFRQHEPQKVLMNLLADLHARIPHICGLPFGLDTKVRYAVPKWNVLTEARGPYNLSEEKPIRSHIVETEEDTDVSLEVLSPPVSVYTQIQPNNPFDTTKDHSISPPPFLPRLSQHLPSKASKPLYVPVFTAKPKNNTCRITAETTTIPLTPRELADKPGVSGEIMMKPLFGKTHAPHPSNIFHKNKSTPSIFGQKKIKPYPIFNIGPSTKLVKEEKTPLHLTDSGNKKVRNRPKVQEGMDVKALAMTRDGLCKVNTTTLIAYLRSEGVACKVKDKKGELVAKVMAHLKLPVPGPATTSTATQLNQMSTDNDQSSVLSNDGITNNL